MSSSRIVGGTDAAPNEFPYLIEFKKAEHYCGGTILNENYIISAVHCFSELGIVADKTEYTVVAGEHNIRIHEGKEQERKIKRIILHENYTESGGTVKNDIALIELETKLDFNPYVQPIIIPNANYEAAGNAIVTGWGTTEKNGPKTDVLKKVTLPIVPHEECVKAYQSTSIKKDIVPSMLCAGLLGVGGKSACNGDSGGPMAIKMENGSYIFVGITSWTIGCGFPDYPGVFTNVAKFVDWIYKNAVSDSEEC